MKNKFILDACCGGRMFWFNKNQKNTIFIDNRIVPPTKISNQAIFEVRPDKVRDFRKMKFKNIGCFYENTKKI